MPAPRLPVGGGDLNNWGPVLNGYLAMAAGINVLDAQWAGGADPAGVTDSTTAIQAALTAAGNHGGDTVYIPNGTYLISAELVMPSGVRLFGDGPATIIKANVTGTSSMNTITGSPVNFEIANLAMDGNVASRTPAGLEYTQCNIYLTAASQGSIHDLWNYNSASNGICLAGSTYVTIANNRCHGNQRNGIALTWSGNQYCTVTGNTCWSQVLYSGIAVDASPYNAITGNTCYNNGVPGANAGAGVWVDGASDGCTVIGNSCHGNRGDGIHLGDTGAAVPGPVNITIVGNTCHTNYRCGIQSVAADTGALIAANNIYNNSQESANFYDGIHLSSISATYKTTNALVIGNIVNANHANAVSIADGNTTGCRIIGNDLSGNNSPWAVNATAYFAQNKGLNPIGQLPGWDQPAVPASATPITNTTSFDVMVLLTGGTVTQVAIGGTNTGLTTGWFRLPAGQTITLTYSSAPTWIWFGD